MAEELVVEATSCHLRSWLLDSGIQALGLLALDKRMRFGVLDSVRDCDLVSVG